MSAHKKSALPEATQESRAVTRALWYAGAALCFWSFGYTAMRGSDLWWHIAGGRWMVDNGTLWVPDPFSFTAAGKSWLNDSWLSDVQLYFWAETFGLETLAYWKWGLVVITWVLLFRLAWRLAGEPSSAFLATLFGIAIAEPFLDVRPQLYSLLGWVVLLELCVRAQRPPRWLPVVYLVWVNLHAGFLLGFICLPVLLAPHFLAAHGSERREVVVIGALCVLACLLNPNGIEVVARPLRYAFDTTSPFRVLGEWLPPFKPGGIRAPLLPYAIGVFGAAALLHLGGMRSVRGTAALVKSLLPLLLAGLTLAMALRSRRFVPFFAITQTLVVAPALARLLAEPLRRVPGYVPAGAALGLGLWWMSALPIRSYAFDHLTAYSTFPIDTCEFINANDLSGKVFAYYNWGGYIHMCTEGRLKVFIDGRADMLYDDDTFRDYLKVLNQRPGWERIIDRSEAEYALWPTNKNRVAASLARSREWRVVYKDIASVLLARHGVQLPVPLKPTPESPFRDTNIAVAQLGDGNVAGAIASFEQALARDPYFMPACIGLARTKALAGEFAVARETIDRCNRIMPDNRQVRMLQAFVDNAEAKAGRSTAP